MLTCLQVQVQVSNTSFIHFPFNNFRYFLTLFSKFFSSFLHSTCSLSVSLPYLAFDGIYHRLWAAIPSNSTPLDGLHAEESGGKTGLAPSPVPCSKGIYPGPPPGTPGTTPRRDWQHGLFPLQSPLLRESWLVSFPPLNYMLKFSGSSYLIWDLIGCLCVCMCHVHRTRYTTTYAKPCRSNWTDISLSYITKALAITM